VGNIQLLGKNAKDAADDLWIASLLAIKVAEKFGVEIEVSSKPVTGDWKWLKGCIPIFTEFLRMRK